jgi:hypothetical protein
MNTMLTADAVKYCTLLFRNIFVAGIIVASHKNLGNGASFTPKNRFYDSTVGRQGEICLEVFMLLTVGTAFQAMSFQQLSQSAAYTASMSGIFVNVALFFQVLNMLALVVRQLLESLLLSKRAFKHLRPNPFPSS